nr:MAG TPA: collagen triple helix repeat protein [Caudoviricetes sp.]
MMDNNPLQRSITLVLDGSTLTPSDHQAGYAGEHCATRLILALPTQLVVPEYTYQLCISAGGTVRRALLQHDNLTFDLPVAVMAAGTIFTSLIISDGTQIIRKSDVCPLTVAPALDTPDGDIDNQYTGLLEDSINVFRASVTQLDAVTVNTPYIDAATGNWMVYDTAAKAYNDTGVHAKGDKGDRGEQGIQGVKGDKGDRGEQGVQGVKGDKGDRGEQGLQGIKGDKGDRGEQGIQGVKGDKGDKGDPGESYDDTEMRASIAALQPYTNNQVTARKFGTAVLLQDGAQGTQLRAAVIGGMMRVTTGKDGAPDTILPSAPDKITLNGTNMLLLRPDSRVAGGLTVSCDGDVIAIGGKCTGTNLYVFDKLSRFDAPFTLHVQVLTGSATGAGMYFTADVLVGFKTQTRYFPNGVTNWNGAPRWVTNSTVFTDDFTCRIWATPGNTPDMPYEPYREQAVPIPPEVLLYATPNAEYQDTYDAASGLMTNRCSLLRMTSGWIYAYSTAADTVTWITNPYYQPSKRYYYVHNGRVTDTGTTDWQGKISMVISKSDAGITADDTAATATQKIKTYFGDAYAILPLKTPATEQLAAAPVTLPAGNVTITAAEGDIDVTYCKDIDAAYTDMVRYTTELEARIAQLELKN